MSLSSYAKKGKGGPIKQNSLLKVENVSIRYKKGPEDFYAVSNVSFEIFEKETVSLVGESGCGKSSIAKAILGISGITEGNITYKDQTISNHKKKAKCKLTQEIQMIFQDPYSSLNPRMTIEEIIKEPLVIYKIGTPELRVKRVDDLLLDVSLPLHYKNRYPHELSGGERQRVSIARALISKPKLLICDEPTHALDCSVQASIINLLKDLKEKHNLSLLFISHDLCLVKNLSDRLLVMYGGFIVEEGITQSIFENPLHPFTQKLLSAIPVFGSKIEIAEEDMKECEMHAPSMSLNSVTLNSCVQNLQKSFTNLNALNPNPKSLCPYLARCTNKGPQCEKFEVQVSSVDKTHKYRCHLAQSKNTPS